MNNRVPCKLGCRSKPHTSDKTEIHMCASLPKVHFKDVCHVKFYITAKESSFH